MTRTLRHPLTAGAALAASIYWALLVQHPYPGSTALKVLPVMLLAGLAVSRRAHGGLVIIGALIAHGTGDVLLDMDLHGLFLPALVSFLIGHVLYAVAFRTQRLARAEWTLGTWAKLGVLIAISATMGIVLVANLSGILRIAIPIYIIGITMMAAVAFAGRWADARVAVGAASYLMSDALIGLNLFVAPIPFAGWIIWPTYALAQILIITGFLDTCGRRGKGPGK